MNEAMAFHFTGAIRKNQLLSTLLWLCILHNLSDSPSDPQHFDAKIFYSVKDYCMAYDENTALW